MFSLLNSKRMEQTVLHVTICYNRYVSSEGADRKLDVESLFGQMAAPFRISFQRVFNEVRLRKFPAETVALANLPSVGKATIDRFCIFCSEKSQGCLNSTEDDSFVVYFTLCFSRRLDQEMEAYLSSNTREVQEIRRGVVDGLIDKNVAPSVAAIGKRHVGDHAWTSTVDLGECPELVACISAFYFYGWIIALRINRSQVQMDIAPRIEVEDSAVQEIIRQRMRLLNLERHFLQEDRAMDGQAKELCITLTNEFNLVQRHERSAKKHLAFEE